MPNKYFDLNFSKSDTSIGWDASHLSLLFHLGTCINEWCTHYSMYLSFHSSKHYIERDRVIEEILLKSSCKLVDLLKYVHCSKYKAS